MKREELLSEGRKVLWAGLLENSEEIISAAPQIFIDAGMLVPSGGAAELERLLLLMNAQPAELTEPQTEALVDAGNRALADYYHERACSCDLWPQSCHTDPSYAKGYWDTDAFTIGLAAVIGLWEVMRAAEDAGEVGRLRARVAELEAQVPYREVWSSELPPGGFVCSVCGQPVESEPCPEHAPQGTADEDPITFALTSQAEALHASSGAVIETTAATVAPDPHPFDREYMGESDAKRRLARCKRCGRLRSDAVHTEDVSPQVAKLRALRASQREDPHDSELHHTYAVPRDFPEVRS